MNESGNKFKAANKYAAILAITLVSIVLASCSSSTKSSVSQTTTQPSGVTSTTSQSSSGGSYDGLSLNKLGSLTNYTAELDSNTGQIFSVEVNSPKDWESLTGPLSTSASHPGDITYNISGVTYSYQPVINGSNVTYAYKKFSPADQYSQSLYPSYVKALIGLTHVTGVKLVRVAACSGAGQSGHIWEAEPSAKGAVAPNISACISDTSGALLTYNQGSSAAIYGQAGSYTEAFTVESIGNVPQISLP